MALEEIKQLVTKPPVLKYYEPEKPRILQCDASEKGLCASLLQDGRPITYASRPLTPECNYAQIEKELLAIVFGIKCFHQHTYGRKVIVDSDHKPLETICQKPLASAPRRLQKMLMRLQQYDIDVRYKKGTERFLADTLSRHFAHEMRCTTLDQSLRKRLNSLLTLMKSSSWQYHQSWLPQHEKKLTEMKPCKPSKQRSSTDGQTTRETLRPMSAPTFLSVTS